MTTPMENEERIRKLEERVAALEQELRDRIAAIEDLFEPVEDPDRVTAPPSPTGRWRVEGRVKVIGHATTWELVGEVDDPDVAEAIANLEAERRIVPVVDPGAN